MTNSVYQSSKCPRCLKGQLYWDADLDEPDIVCLQCGFRPRIEPLGTFYSHRTAGSLVWRDPERRHP